MRKARGDGPTRQSKIWHARGATLAILLICGRGAVQPLVVVYNSCRAEEQRALGTCLRAEAAARRLAHALALAGMSMIGFGFLCGECVLRVHLACAQHAAALL